MDEKLKAVAYARFSSDNQRDESIAELTDKLNSVQENAPKKPTKDEVIQSKKKLAAFLLNPKNTAPAARIMNRTVDCVHIGKESVKIKLKI